MEVAEDISVVVKEKEANDKEELIFETMEVEIKDEQPCAADVPDIIPPEKKIDDEEAVMPDAQADETIKEANVCEEKEEDATICEAAAEESVLSELIAEEPAPIKDEVIIVENFEPAVIDSPVNENKSQPEPVVEEIIEEPEPERNYLHCQRCKTDQSWMWKKISTGVFICTSCENREIDGEEIAPTQRRVHRDSVVILDNEHPDNSDIKQNGEAVGKGEVNPETEPGQNSEAAATALLPTRKSSRSTRSTISNTNPYAYPRPVMSKPKEKKSVIKTAPSYLAPPSTLSLTHQVRYKGTYIKMGDIVSIRGHDGGTYFAQIRGLLEDQYCEKSAALTWLLPTQNSPLPERGFDPNTYIIGMEEDVPRSLDCMEFVMHAPSDYFKIRQPYGFADTYGSNNRSLVL